MYKFEWDETKNVENIKKHGFSFVDSQEAFYDEHRMILHDGFHSQTEDRLFCVGKVNEQIITVRYTMR